MAKTKNFKKEAKPSILDFLKGLTTWLCKPNSTESELKKILDRFPDVSLNFLFNRLMSYNMSYPHIIWFCNKYLNNFYDFNSLSSNKAITEINKVTLLLTIKNIMDINFQSQRNKLFYLKSNEFKDENRRQIKNLLREYFNKVYDKQYHEKELDSFYYLFERGIIIEEDLYQADMLLNNGKKTLKLNLTSAGFDNYETPIAETNIMNAKQYLEFCRKKQHTPEIQTYCQQLEEFKRSRSDCQTCILYNKDMVVLDTNLEKPGPVDVMFVGLNPGTDETKYNKTFIGDPSIILREKIMKFHPNTRWIITNIIMCHTPNEKDLGDWKEVATNCIKDFLHKLCADFPPKVFVTIGRQSKEMFGVTELISKSSGVVYDGGSYKIIPLIHPSSVTRSKDKYGSIFDKSWENIYSNVENPVVNLPCDSVNVEQTVQTPNQTQCSSFLKEEDMIKEVTPDLMLFDIVNLDNDQLLKIFINQQGKKKYQITDYEVPIFIKYSNNWKHNTTITDQVDAFVMIPGKNRYYVNKILKEQLDLIKAV
jgi:uracil-DNA glycosylase family 4